MSAGYQFLPWVRSGAAAGYTHADTLKPVLARPDAKPLTGMPVALKVNERTAVDVAVRLYGPGDVTGIDERAVIRVDPPPGSTDLEPNYFASIEFDTPDFPWMLTPAAAGSNARLRPWLVLAVVPRTELRFAADRPLPSLSADVAELPDLADSWLWAHAQVVQGDTPDPLDLVLTQSQRNLARLLCPRRLEPFTAYTACVVPAFEAGRLAGLGEPVLEENQLAPAWDATRTRVELPVYHHWDFATGQDGDFEHLADLLRGVEAGDVGRRPLLTGPQPYQTGDPGRLEFQGPLLAPDTPAPPSAPPAFRLHLQRVLNFADEPVVTPPVYGSRQAARATVPAEGTGPGWLRELNLDPAARAAAGLGARIVQERQEELMAAAWRQLGDVHAVARLEQRLELGVAVLGSVLRRHIAPLDPGRLLQVVGPAHTRLRIAATLRADLALSGLPPSFSSSAFRRAQRPTGPLARRRAPALQLQAVATQVGRPVPAIGPAAGTLGLVADPQMVAMMPGGGFETPQQTRYRHAITQLRSLLVEFSGAAPPATQPVSLAAFKAPVLARLAPAATLPRRAFARVTSAGAPVAATGQSLITGPTFAQPMYEALRDLSPELLVPGLGDVPPNSVTLLESNPRTIEAFMAGLNHEFSSELLWREFPADLRHTAFRRFWDGGPALPPMHQWQGALGSHFAGGDGQIVLVIRGELLRRYPDTLISAVRAIDPNTLGTEQKLPQFRGRIDPDITFLGFDITPDDAHHWFFVVQEQPSAPRFGLDDRGGSSAIASWDDLSWGHMRTVPGQQLRTGHIIPNTRPAQPAWAFNSAHMAAILRQLPVRVALHAERLL